MNVHILLVMKHLNDNDSVTKEELLDNYKAAAAVYSAYSAYANYISYAAYVDAADAKNRVDYYFSITGENKQDYIDALSPIIASPVYTQAMANHNTLPEVGAWVMVQGYAYKSSNQDWFKVEVLGHYEGKVIAESCSEANRVQLFDKFKPSDTRTDAEKALEDMEHELEAEGIGGYDSIMLKILIEKFKGNKIRGVTFTGDK